MYRAYRFLPLLILLSASCGTPRATGPAPCLKPSQHELVIRWGTEHDSAGTVEGYELDAKGELYRFSGPKSPEPQREFVMMLEPMTYCSTASDVQAVHLKVLALNVRGIRGRFIDYVNASSNVYLRAVWNPDLQTFQSRDMRALYDRLMSLVPSDRRFTTP